LLGGRAPGGECRSSQDGNGKRQDERPTAHSDGWTLHVDLHLVVAVRRSVEVYE
jgi:hypothetical protein